MSGGLVSSLVQSSLLAGSHLKNVLLGGGFTLYCTAIIIVSTSTRWEIDLYLQTWLFGFINLWDNWQEDNLKCLNYLTFNLCLLPPLTVRLWECQQFQSGPAWQISPAGWGERETVTVSDHKFLFDSPPPLLLLSSSPPLLSSSGLTRPCGPGYNY